MRRSAPSLPAFELTEVSVAQLKDGVTTGRYTARRIVELYPQRISQIDSAGPRLRSVIELNPDVLAIADALDAERRTKGPRGPLHGIPVLITDNIDTGDQHGLSVEAVAVAIRQLLGQPRRAPELRTHKLPTP